MPDHSSSAIVLRSQPYKESDRLITVFCLQYGKTTMILKSGLKVKSKMAGHLDIGSVVDLEWTLGRYFHVITGASAVMNLKNTREDLAKIIYIRSIITSLERLMIEKEPQQNIFALTVSFIKLLNNAKSGTEAEMFYQAWWWKVLIELGMEPNLTGVKKVDNFFDFESGGLTKARRIANYKVYSFEEIDYIKQLATQSIQYWVTQNVDRRLIQKGREVLQNFVAFRDLNINQKVFARKIGNKK